MNPLLHHPDSPATEDFSLSTLSSKEPSSALQFPVFPILRPEGCRGHWLSEIRDHLRAESVTIATIYSQSSDTRDPYSSIDSPFLISRRIKRAREAFESTSFPSRIESRWVEKDSFHLAQFASVVPAPEEGKATLVIIEFDHPMAEQKLEQLHYSALLIARESRLIQETERRLSAEEMLYYSQKQNCADQLASGIVHDFNNLLTVVQGHANFLEEETKAWDDPKVGDAIEHIQQATEQSASLVKQILDFNNEQSLNLKPIDLNQEICAFAKMIRRMLDDTIELKLELDTSIDNVRADHGMINQILMNLVLNARNAMQDGGVATITTENIPCQNGNGEQTAIRLIVSDTGCGIPEDKLNEIFEPFYTTRHNGHGLGLANVSRLVRQLLGEIEISSEVGQGTQVSILLPRATQVKAPIKALPDPVAPFASDADGIRGSRVLLVEDEAAVRKLVRKLLEMQGCQVIEASSGRKALDLWPSVRDEISLVVSDVVMPDGVSGWDLAKELHENNPDLGILLTSGYNERPEDHGLEGASNIAFLQKPYEAATLKNNLCDLLHVGAAS